ncbi:MAG TPA: hypothetical protein VF815_35510 [Myxococcaceae bacterium]|jgi:hypothetical protein
MRITLVMIIAAALMYGATAGAAAPVGAGKVFSGPEGESVAVIPLNQADAQGKKQFLLLVQGTGSEFDGKALLHTLYEFDKHANYLTQYRGEDYVTLAMRDRGSKSYELNAPGMKDGLRVSFDEKRTQSLKGDEVYSLHQKQKSDGTLNKLSAFNRKERETEQNQGLAEEVKAMNAACGTQVTATVDWKSVTDDVIKKYSIASYCGSPLTALRSLCESASVAKKIISAKVKKVSCQFGPELKLEMQGDTAHWTTAADAGNQDEFARKFFEKNL